MGQAHLATCLPSPAHGAFRPEAEAGEPQGARRRGELGSWVGEMAGEVADPIWSPAKEEAHQRAVSTGARLGQRGTTVRGGVRWWRWAAHGSGRWSGHRRSLGRLGSGRRRQSTRQWQRSGGSEKVRGGVEVGGNSSTATTRDG
jgi:hypothetical protein